MGILSGKKVLLIAPAYRNYISNIASAFKKLGAYIESYNSDPTSIFYSNFYLSRWQTFSILQRLFRDADIYPNNRQVITSNRNILNSLKDKQFDHVVIIKGRLLTDDFIINLKKLMPMANFVLYQWDSLKNYNYLDRIKHFTTVFSFDYLDCTNYKQISYLPLFYSEEYAKIASLNNIDYEYDLFFLGISHSIRTAKLNEIIDFCKEKGIKHSFNLMTTISESIHLYLNRSEINCFSKALKFDQFSEKYIKSKAILDINSPNQTGLSIRIIEALGANKKIVTTNCNIVNEEFYDPEMIFIWGKDNPEDLMDFLNKKFENKNTESYSVESFVLKLISTIE